MSGFRFGGVAREGVGMSERQATHRPLLQTFDEIQIRQSATVFVNIRVPVGSDEDRTDQIYACGIGRHELFPEHSFPSRDF